jgi:hypothetical protein
MVKRVGRFRIEKDRDVPEDNGPRQSWKAVLDSMDVGESFILPDDIARYARSSIMAYGRMHKKKFLVRTIVEAGVERRCCWRMA